MRMWNVDPAIMCRQHLMGEHVEMHMFAGSMIKGTSMAGYIKNGLLDVGTVKARHDAVADEMTKRGMNHRTPMHSEPPCEPHAPTVDAALSLADLLNRCPTCAANHSKANPS